MSKKYNDIKPTVKVEVQEASGTEEQVEEKRPVTKVISSAPVKVKKNLIGRLITGVIGPEGASGIGEYVANEIIKPAIKNVIVDTVTSSSNILIDSITQGIQMAIFGEVKSRHVSRPGYQRTNYQQQYNRPSTSRYTSHNPEPVPAPQSQQREPARNRQVVEEYLLPDRYDAANVLTTITELADMYGTVSLADYYDLIGVTSVYTDNQYGWSIDSVVKATIATVRGGYVIKFPPLEVI